TECAAQQFLGDTGLAPGIDVSDIEHRNAHVHRGIHHADRGIGIEAPTKIVAAEPEDRYFKPGPADPSLFHVCFPAAFCRCGKKINLILYCQMKLYIPFLFRASRRPARINSLPGTTRKQKAETRRGWRSCSGRWARARQLA